MKEFPQERRQIPAINKLVAQVQKVLAPNHLPHPIAVQCARQIAARLRSDVQLQCSDRLILDHLDPLIHPGPAKVLNGTGILLHTNLGRAPIDAQVVQSALEQVAEYTTLEFDLANGKRGHRDRRFAALARLLWSVEDATLVNNAAAAVTLSLAALAAKGETLVSRGELIEIGGSFRMPDIMNFAGTQLVEVGTTNKTKIDDYRSAIGPQTACLFKAHPSNYRIEGFTQETSLRELAQLGHQQKLPVVMDLGSGLSQLAQLGQSGEATIEECLSAQPDLLIFSGDKLLGGVQAGLVLGTRKAIAQMRKHPMMRMVRVDKLTHALICQQLAALAFNQTNRLMTLANTGESHLHARALNLAERLGTGSYQVAPSSAYLGGGSMPGQARPSFSLVGPMGQAQRMADSGRTLNPPLIGHIHKDAFHINLATIFPSQDETLFKSLQTLAL